MNEYTLQNDGIDDFHVHLRQGELMEFVTPQLKDAGYRSAYVMPNLKPPITTTEMAVDYYNRLKKLAPDVEFFMSLYLNPLLTPEEIAKAKQSGVVYGVKSYPKGVTTNSESGIESYEVYYPVFKAMQEHGLVLNLHGEVPSDPAGNTCVLNAESKFLPHLVKLHNDFPNLKIVLEHATTAEAVNTVASLGSTVAATITIHHLDLIVDDWAGQPHNFCKPVAKYPLDRDALRNAVKSGNPKFFLGTDSAPHPQNTKECAIAHAGVFTSSLALPYLVHLFDQLNCLDRLEAFSCQFGRQFYGLPLKKHSGSSLKLKKQQFQVPEYYEFIDHNREKQKLVPFKANGALSWILM